MSATSTYAVFDKLGSGPFGIVYKAVGAKDADVCAIKEFLRRGSRWDERARFEIEICKQLDHVSLKAAFL